MGSERHLARVIHAGVAGTNYPSLDSVHDLRLPERAIQFPPLPGDRILRNQSRIEPMNRTAAVLKASRSAFERAAAGLRHSRGPVHGKELQGTRGKYLRCSVLDVRCSRAHGEDRSEGERKL